MGDTQDFLHFLERQIRGHPSAEKHVCDYSIKVCAAYLQQRIKERFHYIQHQHKHQVQIRDALPL